MKDPSPLPPSLIHGPSSKLMRPKSVLTIRTHTPQLFAAPFHVLKIRCDGTWMSFRIPFYFGQYTPLPISLPLLYPSLFLLLRHFSTMDDIHSAFSSADTHTKKEINTLEKILQNQQLVTEHLGPNRRKDVISCALIASSRRLMIHIKGKGKYVTNSFPPLDFSSKSTTTTASAKRARWILKAKRQKDILCDGS